MLSQCIPVIFEIHGTENQLAQIGWNGFINGPGLPVVARWSLIGLVVITTLVTWRWRQVRITEAEVSLKLRMIERGYSADEVERVLRAGLPTKPAGRCSCMMVPPACRDSLGVSTPHLGADPRVGHRRFFLPLPSTKHQAG